MIKSGGKASDAMNLHGRRHIAGGSSDGKREGRVALSGTGVELDKELLQSAP